VLTTSSCSRSNSKFGRAVWLSLYLKNLKSL